MGDDDFVDGFDDEIPWASPEIQLNYEAALGRFILAFNSMDNLLTNVLTTVLLRIGRKDMIDDCTKCDLWRKLLCLELLKSSVEGGGIANVPVDQIKQIVNERNKLAHGHFDQNPFDGSYQIVGKKVYSHFSAERLADLTTQTGKVCSSLRGAQAIYDFSGV